MVKIPSPQVFVQGQGSTSADNLNSFVQVCDTAARLATFTGLPNMMVDLLGITAPNDGGQGLFFYVSGTGFVSDGFNVIVPNGVTTGAWLRLTVVAAGLSSNGPITFTINGTQVGVFTVDGNFGIGTNPPPGTQIMLDIGRNQNTNTFERIANNNTGNNAAAGILLNNSSSALQLEMLSVGYSIANPLYRADSGMIWCGGSNGMSLVVSQPASLVFATNNQEVARLTSTGQFLLGTTAAGGTAAAIQFSGGLGTIGLSMLDTNAAAGNDYPHGFYRSGTLVGSISTFLTGTAFNTSSDKNLKTLDETRTLDSGEIVDSVSPHEFTWNLTGEPDFGFFAQELNAATGDTIPGAVSIGSPDEEFGTPEYRNWGVDLSKLVPVLWAEIQSLRKRVAQLEGAP